MSSIADLSIWDDPQLADRLGWYRDVADDRQPAKFRIAASMALTLSQEALAEAPEDQLWERWKACRGAAAI